MAETPASEPTPPPPGDYSDTEDYSDDVTPDFDAEETNRKGGTA